jgi:hypothetical protein
MLAWGERLRAILGATESDGARPPAAPTPVAAEPVEPTQSRSPWTALRFKANV